MFSRADCTLKTLLKQIKDGQRIAEEAPGSPGPPGTLNQYMYLLFFVLCLCLYLYFLDIFQRQGEPGSPGPPGTLNPYADTAP